jgi:hypothetical protein
VLTPTLKLPTVLQLEGVCRITRGIHLPFTYSIMVFSPFSILEVGYSLSPDKIYGALVKAMTGPSRNSAATTSCDQFLVQAADSFLTKVNKVR